MSNYSEYFNELSNSNDKTNNLNYGNILNHKFNNNKRRYNYTHPNQLRTMKLHSAKKISDSKQNDILGAIELLTYQPPPILPISFYEKQTGEMYYGSGKKKPFLIEEEEMKKPKSNIPISPITPIKPIVKPIVKPNVNPIVNPATTDERNIKKSDNLLNTLIKEGVARVPVRNNKVPLYAIKQDEIRKKTKHLQEKLNKPLVSRPKKVIRMGFDVPDVGGGRATI